MELIGTLEKGYIRVKGRDSTNMISRSDIFYSGGVGFEIVSISSIS